MTTKTTDMLHYVYVVRTMVTAEECLDDMKADEIFDDILDPGAVYATLAAAKASCEIEAVCEIVEHDAVTMHEARKMFEHEAKWVSTDDTEWNLYVEYLNQTWRVCRMELKS